MTGVLSTKVAYIGSHTLVLKRIAITLDTTLTTERVPSSDNPSD